FHQKGRWTEGNVAAFAWGCLDSRQWERAVTYYNEAIVLHQRANPASGINDQSLSEYYQHLADSQSKLKHTKEAVDAASAAIVCWEFRHGQRGQALETLKRVLAAAENLDAYVAQMDADAAMSGQDSPILRRIIGEVYRSRSDHPKAIAQFKLALQ